MCREISGFLKDTGYLDDVFFFIESIEKEERKELLPLIKATDKELTAYEIIMDYSIQCEKLELAKWLFSSFKKKLPNEDQLIKYYEGEFSPE